VNKMDRHVRVVLAVFVATTAALLLAFAGAGSAETPYKVASAQVDTTALTVAIRSCEGCEVTLLSYTDTAPDAGWSSGRHVIANGKAVFVVPTERTVGMSIMVHTPWEGHTGYATMMVFRYQRMPPSDRIGFNNARNMKKASGCWAGTKKEAATLRFKVHRVRVQGVHKLVPGQIAWAPITQRWLRPMLPVYGGVLGAQDVILCRPGA
jgi:hypothetical protein